MSFPKVTIAMPVFNGGDYFEEALDSALAQTYRNIEILAVNDGSTDGGHTDRVAERYARHIRYIRKENGGVASALNTVIENMTGDVFTWLSHDDLFEPHKTEAQVDYWRRLGKRDACLVSDFFLMDANGVITMDVKLERDMLVKAPMLPLFRGMISGCTIFVPKVVLDEVGGFDVRLRHAQDYDLWHRIVMRHEFFHVPQTLVRSRQHPGQDSAKHDDAAIETEALWRGMVLSLSETERAGMYGSSYRFWSETAKLTFYSPNKQASALCSERAEASLSQTLVSIVTLAEDDAAAVIRSVNSALAQTYRRLEVVLVGSAQALAHPELKKVLSDPRVRQVVTDETAAVARWNAGLRAAGGAYVALLAAGDAFAPGKIEQQAVEMMKSGAQASHTAYQGEHSGRSSEGPHSKGGITGAAYPQIIAENPVAISTVMLHRSLIAGGLTFADESEAWDLLAWIDVGARGPWLGLDAPLSTVQEANGRLNPDVHPTRASALLTRLEADPLHSQQETELARLRALIASPRATSRAHVVDHARGRSLAQSPVSRTAAAPQ